MVKTRDENPVNRTSEEINGCGKMFQMGSGWVVCKRINFLCSDCAKEANEQIREEGN